MTYRLKLAPVMLVCVWAALGAHAQPPRHQQSTHAQPAQVIDRLTTFGELTPPQARLLQKAVSKRMKRAASRDNHDVIRAAVSRAVLAGSPKKHGTRRPNPALVRRRLRAGLDVWALEQVFVPGTAAMRVCDRGFALTPNLCEALLAAGGGVSLAGAHVLGGHQAEPEVDAPVSQERTFASIAPRAARVSPVAERTPELAPRPSDAMVAPQPRLAAKAQTRPEPAPRELRSKAELAPAPRELRSKVELAPAPRELRSKAELAPAPRELRSKAELAPAPTPAPPEEPSAAELADIARRKAEYQRQRDAYLERQRAELEARKARMAASAAGERVQRGPASEMEARVAGLSGDSVPKPHAEAAAGKHTSADSNAGSHSRPAASAAASAGSEDEVDNLVGDLLSK